MLNWMETRAMNLDSDRLKRVSTLFDELHDLTVDQRAERLAELSNAEPEVAAELSRWLKKDGESEGVLDALTQRFAAQNSAVAPDRSGQRVGAYALLRRVGRGGMGEVYEARRPGADFEQKVAIKLLRRGLDSEDIVRRFLRERRILAQLEHPGIARLIDGGVSNDGQPYLVMEFVEGRSLIEAANARALDLNARLNLFLHICDAVAYAHRRLIVHRDLKPSNLLLTEDDQPKLLDFGIAKLLDDVDDEHLTGTGMRLLTPGYAAPEQILGQPISTATDVYALGLILYELLTGHAPHQRHGKDLERVTRDLDQERVIPPSAAVLNTDELGTTTQTQRQKLARQLAGDIDTIVLHALKREPERRYQGAAELADDIRRHFDGHPVRAEADTITYRMRKFITRHRGGVTAATLAVLGIVAGLVIALWQADIARQQAQRAEAETQRAEREAAAAVESASRTKRVKEFMMETFIAADPIRRASEAPQTLTQALDDALIRVDSDLGDDPKLQIDLLDDFGEVRAGQGRFDEARTLFTRALTQAESVYGPDHPVVAESLINRGAIEAYAGNPALSVPFVERAIAILEQHFDTDPLALVNALSSLGQAREAEGKREESMQLIKRALDIQREFGKPDDLSLNVAIHNYATTLINANRYDEAEPFIRESIALQEKSLGVESPALEALLDNLSIILYRRGEIDAAIKTDERRLRISRKAFPGAHPWTASALTDLGEKMLDKEPPTEAKAYFDEAIAMYETLDSPEVLDPLRYRAIMEHNQGDDIGALASYERSLRICGQRKIDHPRCALALGNHAGILARMGQGEQALSEAETAIKDAVRLGMAGSSELAQAIESKALALNALGKQEAAMEAEREALAIYAKKYGESHPETQRVRNNLEKLRKSTSASQ
jgi:eukaryotic-like serine/threonine-protein kinase